MLALWQEYRSGGFGAGHLPFAGGAAEQPAILMDALHLLSGAAELLKPKKPDREQS